MGFTRIEPRIGIAFSGIAIAVGVPAYEQMGQGFESNLAIAGVMGIIGVTFGMATLWDNAESIWPYSVWILLGLGFAYLMVTGALGSHHHLWQAGLGALALVQLAAVMWPVTVYIRNTRNENKNNGVDDNC